MLTCQSHTTHHTAHTAPHRTTPHHTAPHRTAPHRTAPHRTAPKPQRPHRTALHCTARAPHEHARAHTHDAAAACTYTTQGGWVGGLAWRWVIARSPSPPPQREVNNETALTTPPHHAQSRPATRRQATPTPRPRPRTHARRSRRMHTHGAGRAGGCAWRWVVYGRSGRAGSFRTAPSILGAGETGAGETHNGERIGRACALGGQAGGTAACAARRVRARRGRAAGFAWCGDRQPQTTGDGAQRATGRSGRRGASVDGRLMRLPRARTGALA